MPEEQGRLSIVFAAGVEVDVPRVLSGDVPVDEAKRLRSGELLAGLGFDDEPGFDSWLLLQRSRISAAVGEVLAWAASTLAHTEREIGYVALLDARYGAAEEALERSIASAEIGDAARTARALRLATTGPMPDLFERLRERSMLQTRTQTGDG